MRDPGTQVSSRQSHLMGYYLPPGTVYKIYTAHSSQSFHLLVSPLHGALVIDMGGGGASRPGTRKLLCTLICCRPMHGDAFLVQSPGCNPDADADPAPDPYSVHIQAHSASPASVPASHSFFLFFSFLPTLGVVLWYFVSPGLYMARPASVVGKPGTGTFRPYCWLAPALSPPWPFFGSHCYRLPGN